MRNYTFFSDPGHAWLRVPIKDLTEYNVQDKITSYSYVSPSGKYAYLEEDLDATTFLVALAEAHNILVGELAPFIKQKNCAKHQSAIRNYPQYSSQNYRNQQ